ALQQRLQFGDRGVGGGIHAAQSSVQRRPRPRATRWWLQGGGAAVTKSAPSMRPNSADGRGAAAPARTALARIAPTITRRIPAHGVPMKLRSYLDRRPTLGARVYVDPAATVIGDVELGDDAS